MVKTMYQFWATPYTFRLHRSFSKPRPVAKETNTSQDSLWVGEREATQWPSIFPPKSQMQSFLVDWRLLPDAWRWLKKKWGIEVYDQVPPKLWTPSILSWMDGSPFKTVHFGMLCYSPKASEMTTQIIKNKTWSIASFKFYPSISLFLTELVVLNLPLAMTTF